MGKKKSKKKIVIIGIAIVAIILILYGLFAGKQKPIDLTEIGYTDLAKTDLMNSVDVSGNIKSETEKNVYSTLNYPVKTIYVKVGDKVSVGDKLAELDTSSLSMDIEQQESTIENSKKTSKIDMDNKKRVYENAKSQYDKGLNTEIVNAKSAVSSTKTDYQTKKDLYENNKSLYQSGKITKEVMDQSETVYKAALSTYNKAKKTLKAVQNKVDQDLKTYEASVKAAEIAYHNDSQKIALNKLKKNQKDSVITSPINGTVTAVNAVEGSVGNGVLFVIDDTDQLSITTNIKEYDSAKVTPNQKVIIKTDATGDTVINGEVVSIAPASGTTSSSSTLGASASTATSTSGTAEYETKISILDKNEKLKLGMSARLNIILDKKESVYSVPFEAITKNESGQDIVYCIYEENGKNIIKEIPVKKGMETDLYTEITGDQIKDGLKIINDAESVTTKKLPITK